MHWKRISSKEFYTFRFGKEPELIHLIRSGYEANSSMAWIVVPEDGYDMSVDTTELMSSQRILEKYGIDVTKLKNMNYDSRRSKIC